MSGVEKTFILFILISYELLKHRGQGWPVSQDSEYDDDWTAEDEGSEEDTSEPVNDGESFLNYFDQLEPSKIYDDKTKKFYPAATQGPCSNNLKFIPASKKENEKFGVCGCHQWAQRGSLDHVPLVYNFATEKCYKVYHQAYCKKGQWLVYTSPSRVQCVHNPCFHAHNNNTVSNNNTGMVWFDGHCVKLGSNCLSSSKESSFKVMFKDFEIEPTCAKYANGDTVTGKANYGAECPKGRRPVSKRRCLFIDVVV